MHSLGAIKQFIGGNSGGQEQSGGFQQKVSFHPSACEEPVVFGAEQYDHLLHTLSLLQIIGMAMAQASQLFDQKQANGQVTGGDKQSAVNQAGEAAMKVRASCGDR